MLNRRQRPWSYRINIESIAIQKKKYICLIPVSCMGQSPGESAFIRKWENKNYRANQIA